jgi:formylmethanofuran:tetrahydromethanopterin formyltransferase
VIASTHIAVQARKAVDGVNTAFYADIFALSICASGSNSGATEKFGVCGTPQPEPLWAEETQSARQKYIPVRGCFGSA